MAIEKWTAPFADGWYPRISPDGRYVMCGSKSVRVIEIASKRIIWHSAETTQRTSQGWLNPTSLVMQGNVALVGQREKWATLRVDAPFGGTQKQIGPALNFAGAGGNVWAGGNTRQIYVGDANGNAHVIAEGYAATCDEFGTVVYSIDVHTKPKLVAWKAGQILRTIVPLGPTNRFLCGAGGYVGNGYYGPSWINTPDNKSEECGVTPDHKESPPLAFRHLGAVWLATTDDDGVYLRPLGVRDKAMIVAIPFNDPYGGAVDCSVVSLGAYILVASNDAKGTLTISTVPAETAMVPVPDPRPPKPPIPPVVIKAKATIETYDGEVLVNEKAKAVAKVTQGEPDQFRWQYLEGNEWKKAALNPATDLDHSYVFPNAGRYPIRLQTLQNGEVTDQTSSTSRAITVTTSTPEPEPPEPEPPQPPSDVHALPTYQTFVEVEQYEVAQEFKETNKREPNASDMGHNAWRRLVERWSQRDIVNDIAGDPLEDNGAYQPFNKVVPDYDTFVNQECPDVEIAFEGTNGRSMSPGDCAHNAYRRLVEYWSHRDIIHDIKGEPLEDGGTMGEPPVAPIRPGVVKPNKYQYIDGAGGWLPWGTTLFWGLYGYLHERSRIEQHLEFIRSMGADYVRVIATGLKKGEQERSCSPSDPNFQSGIAGFTDLAAQYGLRTQWTIFGAVYNASSTSARQSAVDKVCAALQPRQDKVFMVEIANEGWTNGFDGDKGVQELKDLTARVASKLGVLVAPTCPEPGDDITEEMVQKYYKNTKATVQTHHYSRSIKAPDGHWRPVRKPWRESNFAVDGCCSLVCNNEPIGPDSSGDEEVDPMLLGMAAATSWLCGVGAYCLHCGAGIYGVPDSSRGRPADLWATQNIDAIAKAIQFARSVLPADLPNWSKHQANSSSAPFTFVDVPEEQFTMAYSATSGPGIVILPGGVVKTTTWNLRSGSCDGTVYHPVTGQVLAKFDKSFTVSPSVPGVIVVAKKK